MLLDELEMAIDELPEDQRAVFVAHELEGRSFKDMAAETGVSMNTLLSRKRYAVLRLLLLCRILFGGFGRGFHRGGHRGRTPEERERFRQAVRERFGFGPTAVD